MATDLGTLRLGFRVDLAQLQRGLAAAEGRLKQAGDRMEGVGQTMSTRLAVPLARVGESDVPDMVNRIERQFARLDGAMVRPVEEANRALGASFETLASSTMSVLGSLVRQGSMQLGDFKRFALRAAADIADTLARTLGRVGGRTLAQAFAPAAGTSIMSVQPMHRGGVVGPTAGAMRRLPAPVMAAAPRLHAGLRGDEFPAILQRGETVLPRGMGTAPVKVVINDHRGASAPPIDVRQQAGPGGLREIIVNIMAEDARRNGPAFRATAAALGGQRVGRGR
ncbi:MAG: hypothetical protein ACE5JZ_03065 [Kiloniellales bacterium]